MKAPKRRRRTLGDVWFANMQADDHAAPPVRQPANAETHQRPIGVTRPVRPVRQSSN